MNTNQNDSPMITHPILLEARQIGPNQILINYDQRTDLASAMNVSNYWIRSNVERPVGVATVGMSAALSASNSIRPDVGMITPLDDSNMRFVMTFTVNIMSGGMYTVLPCFVNLEGRSGYKGENWGPLSRNMFIGI
ncbi:hypothetical protein PB01_08610 [Psychrobacillus glaciei]|uniref:Uncharacterized protein n=1 Tax=Psychrobacillus glaciei TaxID=2283160 RepID=A0A5J6SM65_9BACI|nr:hypothetical protein [Psychrobacillus glaciei]QFF98889.1 hypothetical protein PB01_08610 [Psychrobacillus glaciei]